MRLVAITEPGVVELNWTWLPTWLGMSAGFKSSIEKKISERFVNQPLTDQLLDEMHTAVIEDIVQQHSTLRGLRDYLDAVKFVEDKK